MGVGRGRGSEVGALVAVGKGACVRVGEPATRVGVGPGVWEGDVGVTTGTTLVGPGVDVGPGCPVAEGPGATVVLGAGATVGGASTGVPPPGVAGREVGGAVVGMVPGVPVPSDGAGVVVEVAVSVGRSVWTGG